MDDNPRWDESRLPGRQDALITDYICRSGTGSKPFKPAPDAVTGWDKAPNPTTYASFGDNGLTASVNAYGDIMQFARYLGAGRSGMFSVDHLETSEPCYVRDRAEDLQNLCTERNKRSHGTVFEEFSPDQPPNLMFVHNRWPRYEYEVGNARVAIQWMVHDETLLHQVSIENLASEQREVAFGYANSIQHRDLEYLDNWYGFNYQSWDNGGFSGPHSFSHVTLHPLPSKLAGEDESNNNGSELNDDASGTREPSEGGEGDDAKLESIGIVVSIFVDGNSLQWNEARQRYDGLNTLSSWKQIIEPSATLEVVTAYRMIPVPKSVIQWQNFVIPAKAADVNKFLHSDVFGGFDPAGLRLVELQPRSENQASDTVSEIDVKEKQPEPPLSESRLRPSPVLTGVPSDYSVDHIEYLMRRNLEHILSVCAIPIKRIHLFEREQWMATAADHETIPVALTCGDMSDHRLCASASFFAFQFLLAMRKRLAMVKSTPYTEALCHRIDLVCRGHIVWLSKVLEKSKTMYFKANYWATGEEMTRSANETRTPQDALTDTPFQLIKVAEFATVYKDAADQELAKNVMARVCVPWGETLVDQRVDKRRRYAWPRDLDEGVNFFRLDDHIWVWRALNSIEDLDVWSGLASGGETRDLAKQLRSVEVQREVLGRFTTVNDVSRRRMLAVTRSARETRFMFHARDTVLFYAMDWGFPLHEGTLLDVWENTIDAQQHHDGNQETNWDNAIRYALAVLMGSRGCRINQRPPDDLAASSLKTLLKSTSPNGFFGGQLDKTTKEPIIFINKEDRDFYFHASFEIPYILLREWGAITAALQRNAKLLKAKTSKGSYAAPRSTFPLSSQSRHNLEEFTERLTSQPKHHMPLHEEGEFGLDASVRKGVSMEKYIPFSGTIVDPSSIAEVGEEWLYNYPTFLQREKALEGRDIHNQLDALRDQSDAEYSKAIVIKAAQACRESMRTHHPESDDSSASDRGRAGHFRFSTGGRSCVVDTERRQRTKQRQRKKGKDRDGYTPTMIGNYDLWSKLSGPRNAQEAKKRFIWLPRATDEIALICYLASTEVEKPEIFLFFDRHANQENYFADDPAMIYNKWESEFHLSFYHVVDSASEDRAHGIPKPVEEKFPGDSGKSITRASIGFRFDGDFFDRYWTCHFIEYLPGDTSAPEWKSLSFEHSDKSRSWRQRKVLELRLFDRMLTEIVKNARLILEEARAVLNIQPGTMPSVLTMLPVLSSDAYFSARDQWQRLFQILQAVEDDLSSILIAISKWDTREKDRGPEKPRWTNKDESKYRGELRKFGVSTARKTRDLQSYHTSILALKETLASSRDNVRDDLSLLGAENIRFFTYVTVVFLPLGFAASIFSMSDSPPESGILISMVILAVCALAVTAVALVNAKTLNLVLEHISSRVNDYSTRKMNSSYIVMQQRERNRGRNHVLEGKHAEGSAFSSSSSSVDVAGEKDEEASVGLSASLGPKLGDEPAERSGTKRRNPGIDRSWHIDFWLAYVFVEFPARRVMLAFGTLKGHKISWAAFIRVILGVAMLPVFIISWVARMAAYNVIDMVSVLFALLTWSFTVAPLAKNEPFDNHMRRLTYPPESHRPLKRFLRRLNGGAGLKSGKGGKDGKMRSLERDEKEKGVEGSVKSVESGLNQQAAVKNVFTSNMV